MTASRTPVHDFSAASAALGADLCRRLPELSHIDPRRLLYSLVRSRAEGEHGVYARIAPLRFSGGAAELVRRRGRHRETWRQPTLQHEGRDILYLVHFFVPRFLRLPFERKLATLVHELYHVSEACDGDIRRYPGRNFAHGSSRAAYNRIVDRLVQGYLATDPDPELLAFLHLDETGWMQREYRLTGLAVPLPRPRLVARERL